MQKPTYLTTFAASEQLSRTNKEVIVFALENNIPLYAYIGSLNNIGTIGDKNIKGELKIMEGPLYPIEKPLNNRGGETPCIITYRNTCKPVTSSGYEELRPKDIKQIINNGSANLLGFKSNIAAYCRYIQTFIDVSITEVYINKTQLYRFKEQYLTREDFNSRNARMLRQAIELYRERFRYDNIIEIVTNEENVRLSALNLPTITKGTVTKIIRKNMIIKNSKEVNNV